VKYKFKKTLEKVDRISETPEFQEETRILCQMSMGMRNGDGSIRSSTWMDDPVETL
jgi:hypothetical protein